MRLFKNWSNWLSGIVIVILLGLSREAVAQPYGLNQAEPFNAYLNNTFPNKAPNTTTTFDVEVAFTNLTFNLAMQLIPYPNTNRLVLVEKSGRIRMFENRRNVTQGEVAMFLDISDRVFDNSDSGATGIAFHPEFGQPGSTNRGFVYITYKWRPSGLGGNSDYGYIRLSRFTVPDGQMTADPSSELILIQQFDQQQFHDAGHLEFGADSFLYFGIGDEGGANDEYNVTQKLNERLHAGIFRIDVNQNPALSHPIIRQPFHHPNMPASWPESFTAHYYIPNSNPFVNPDGSVLEEYYALGLRNPYRFSRDPVTGLVWVGDVGQATMEEVNILQPGRNYQWAYLEGTANGPKAKPASNDLIGIEQGPLWEYGRSEGGCVIGGFVYRGVEFPSLTGKYICVDNVSGAIWALSSSNGVDLTSVERIATMPPGSVYGGTSSCGRDANGEIYFLKVGGTGAGRIYKLKAQTTIISDPPAQLSQLGAFTSLASLTPVTGFYPYEVNTPLWSDNAGKRRWLAVPNNGTHNTPGEQIAFSPDDSWRFPAGMVFIKHFDLPINDTNSALVKRLETRFLVMDGEGGAYGLTYKWRDDESDADLLTTSATQDYEIVNGDGTIRTQTWYFPSRSDCMSCHTANAGYVLGVRTHQLNCPTTYPATGITDNQLRALGHIGLLGTNYSEVQLPNYLKAYSLTNAAATLEERVRSYLDSNCSQCHRPNGVNAYFDARYTTPLADQGIIRGPTILFLNSTNDRVVVPQDVASSLLHNRANRVGQFQMPPLAKNVVDSNAVELIAAWINSLPIGPTATLSGPANVNGAFSVIVQFSAAVTGLTAGDFQVENGSVTGFSGSGTTYAVTITPLAYGPVRVKLPANQAQDGSAQGNYESNLLTVNYSDIPAGLVHRWSFNDGTDSIGGATASLTGAASISGGKLLLPGGGVFMDYASVNISNTLATSPTISVEAWFRMTTIQNWSKLWMFGRDAAGEPALSYINFTPNTAGGYPKLDFDTAFGGELNTTAAPNPGGLNANTDYHVVAVFDSGSDLMLFYINGELVDLASMGGGDITQLNANLARFGAGFFWGDPDLSGSIDELRIWNVALSDETIANSYAAGPDNLPAPGHVPPTISSIPNQTIFTNTSTGPIAFQLTPGSVPIENVTLSGSSSSQTLVPDANIVIGGSGLNRTVTVTPAPNQNGTVTITISAFDGVTTVHRNFQLAVNIVPPEPVLLHRWSFNGNTNDAIGNAHASLRGAATISGNALQIPGGAPRVNCATVDLASTFAANGSVSIETWFTVNTMQDWSKVWMFGRNTGSQPSLCNLSFTPRIGSAGNFPKIEIDPPTLGEISTVGGPSDPGMMSAGVLYHVVTVYDAYNDTMSFYINGVWADAASMSGFNITDLNINECYFGAAVFYNDPNLNGSIDEMRIWNGPLSAERIAQNYALGPNSIGGPGYEPPTLSEFGDLMTTPGVVTLPQPFNVTPGSVPAGSLNISAVSSNPTLIPNTNITLGGSGLNRTISVLPVAGQRGTATITVSVNDGVAQVTRSFLVAVTAPPVAHYRFDGNAQDSSGNGNHGTANGGTSYTVGKVGSQAISFNGVNAYVDIPVATRTSFSILFWARTTDTGATGGWFDGKGFVDGDVPGATTDFGTALVGGKFGFGVGNPNTTITSSTSVNDGQWHLLAVTRSSASGAMNLYVDGQLEATATGPTGTRAAPTFLRIGAIASGGGTKFLNGTMDDVRLYDYVLSSGEIAALTTVPEPPVITVPPANQSVALGGDVTLEVTATGSAPLSYQWRKNGINLAGANFASLELSEVQFSDAGNYSVVVANNGGSVTSVVAIVTVYNPQTVPGLLHRWSFNDGTDSVGGAHAVLIGNATYLNGQLQLPSGGVAADFATVNLGSTLSNYPSVTVETWFTLNQLNDWSKVWMFGRDAAAQPGLSYINFTPRSGIPGNPPKIDFDPIMDGELNTLGGANPPALIAGSPYHVVAVFDAANDLMSFYINGVLADSAAMGGRNITNLQANLARFGAGFHYADPDLNGSIDELRIWAGAMSAAQVATNFANGPEMISAIVPRPAIESYELVAGPALRLGGAGVVGQTYVLQAATSLTSPIQWTSIATNTVGISGQFEFHDSQVANQPRRFYRVATQ